jgi:hypothetical protein
MKSTSRAFLAAVVTGLASVAILVTLLAHYASVLANPSGFASRAVSVVHTGAVESLIVDSVTNRLVGEAGDQAVAQPTIKEGVREALYDRQITREIRAAAETLQSELASGQANALTLTLPDIGPATAASLESRSPQLAEVVSRTGTITVLDVRIPSTATTAIHDLAVVGRDSSLLIVLSAAMMALALILSPDRRRTLLGLGLGAFAAGLLAAAIYLIGRALVVDQFSLPAARTAAHAAWNAYLGGLESSGLVLAGIGAVVAAVAALSRRQHGDGRPHLAWDA